MYDRHNLYLFRSACTKSCDYCFIYFTYAYPVWTSFHLPLFRLRFLRYDPGEYFKPHMDGTYQRENGDRSYITIQLYLNEVIDSFLRIIIFWNRVQTTSKNIQNNVLYWK